MSDVKALEARVARLEVEVKKLVENSNFPHGVIRYKKCHDCQSDLILPLKIVYVGENTNKVYQYIECPICLGQTSCTRQVQPEF